MTATDDIRNALVASNTFDSVQYAGNYQIRVVSEHKYYIIKVDDLSGLAALFG